MQSHACAYVCAILTIVPASAPAQGPAPSALTIIDGKTDPNKIPVWLQWETLLRRSRESVATIENDEPKVMKGVLFLGPSDLSVIRLEGERHSIGRDAHARRVQAAIETFDRQGKTPQQVTTALHGQTIDLEIEYRNGVLAARDRILSSVSPEGAAQIVLYLSDVVVPSTKLHLHELDLKTFALPQQ
jgi:hypothetical protein